MIAGKMLLDETVTANHEITDVENDTDSSLFSLGTFEARGRRYVLKEPTQCYRKVEQGYFVFECPEYHVSGYALNKEEAFRELNADFACLYDGLAHEPDTALTLDAIEARNRLLERVARVETAEVETDIQVPALP